jgi:hypothetical protein
MNINLPVHVPIKELNTVQQYLSKSGTHSDLVEAIHAIERADGKDVPAAFAVSVVKLQAETDKARNTCIAKYGRIVVRENDPPALSREMFQFAFAVDIVEMWLRTRQENAVIKRLLCDGGPLADDLRWAISSAIDRWAADNIRDSGCSVPNALCLERDYSDDL